MAKKILLAANMLIVFAFFGVLSAFAQVTDTTAPVISGVSATGIAQTAATIQWTTDEPADGQTEYGTSTAYGLSSALVTATTTAHSISLTGLTASTTYHYLVKSKDVAGNLATSTDYSFTTLAVPAADTTAPVISGVTVSGITDTSATINWITDEPADSQAEYGTSTAYGIVSPLITATTTVHHIALSSLTASTTYHFIVKSKDVAGNLATSTDYSFTTLVTPVVSTVSAKLKVEPRVLNTNSRGNWIEAEVTFPRGTDIRTLDVSSIKLNGAIVPVKVKTTKYKWYESFKKKTPKAEMKFSRAETIDLLLSGITATSTTATASSTTPVVEKQQRTLTVSGTIGGKAFSANTTIYLVIRTGPTPLVIFPHKEKKHEREEEREEREHRPFVTATSTATTTAPVATTTAQIVPMKQKHKDDDDSILRNPFLFITAPFASIKEKREEKKEEKKEMRKENEKKNEKRKEEKGR